MNKNLFLLAILAIITMPKALSQSGFVSKWDNGYKLESNDGNFKMKFGGRIQYDFAAFAQDEEMEKMFEVLKDGVEFRRVRFFNSGTVYSNIKYKVQLSYEGGGISFKDVFIEIGKIPIVGNFRIGHFKEPFRLEVLSSSNFMTFMERSFHSEYAPERNTGLCCITKSLTQDCLGKWPYCSMEIVLEMMYGREMVSTWCSDSRVWLFGIRKRIDYCI